MQTVTVRWLALLALVGCTNEYEEKAHERSGLDCNELSRCRGIVLVDCQSAVDGPTYYFEEQTLEVISVCGGACWLPHPDPANPEVCRACPPAGWTCGN